MHIAEPYFHGWAHKSGRHPGCSSATARTFASHYTMDAQPQTQRQGLRRLLRPRMSNSPTPGKPNESAGTQKGKTPITRDPDTERTIARQEKAYALLLSCLPKSQKDDAWNFLEFSQLENDARDFDDDRFIQKVNEILESRKGGIEDDASWSKCCQTVGCIFAALIPLSKNFLTIANPGQSVSPSFIAFDT